MTRPSTKQVALKLLQERGIEYERVPMPRWDGTFIEVFYPDGAELAPELTSLLCQDWQDVIMRVTALPTKGSER